MIAQKFPALVFCALTLTLLSAGFSACQTTMTAASLTQTSTAAAPTSTSQPPTPSATLRASPESSPTSVPLNVSPDVKAVIDAQKAANSFKVDGQGRAVITVESADVTLEKLIDTKTDFGLAEDILNGIDQTTGIRYLYTEKGSWAKVIEPGTPEHRTKIDYGDFANGRVNASAALLYQDHPTIPQGAINPQWWLTAGGSKEVGGYIGKLSIIPIDNNKEIQFKKSTQPYGTTPTLWLEFSRDDQTFVTVVQPNKNPDKINDKPSQLINMNWTFDKDFFDQELGRYLNHLKNHEIRHDNIIDYFLTSSTIFQALIATDSSRQQIFNRWTYLAGPDGIFNSPNLQQPGKLLSLFSPEEQKDIISVWQQEAQIPWGNIGNEKMDISIKTLPYRLALNPLATDIKKFPWGDIQP